MNTNQFYGNTTSKLNPHLFSFPFAFVQANTNYEEGMSIK
jgi:hypothetical protein